MKGIPQPEYSELAEIYDTVMDDVNYTIWADFIDEIIQRHHPDPKSILELACGTGSLSLALDRYGYYEQIMGTDKSSRMIQKAREKAEGKNAHISFQVMDFLNITLDQKFDIIVSIFDSVNYLQTEKELKQLLAQTKKIVRDRYSLFIFDFTTPKNSLKAVKWLNNNEGTTPNHYHFFSKSWYDEKQRIHYNSFEIEKLSDDHQRILRRYSEEHCQRAYPLIQMQRIIRETEFNIKAAYSEFELNKASSESRRITMVLTCPNIPS